VQRGRTTQNLVAQWFQGHGWKDAKSRPASLPGIDVYDMLGLACEVKAKPGDLTGALKQAVANANGALPFVVWRPNGYGPERMSGWPVVIRLDHFTDLLREAGYGSDE
jgi:hypothetical protein